MSTPRGEDNISGFARLGLLASLVALSAACGTVETKLRGGWGRPYSGVPCDVQYVKSAVAANERFAAPIPAVDVVLSAVVDTVLLPADLIVRAFRTPDRVSPSRNPIPDACAGR